MRYFLLSICILRLSAAPAIHKYTVTRAGEAYGITVAVLTPEAFTEGMIEVTIADPQGELLRKSLSSKDLDIYTTVRPRRVGDLSVRVENQTAAKVKVEFSPLSITKPTRISAQPNGDWKNAQAIELGPILFGSADEGGFQWFRFSSTKAQPVYFDLETPGYDSPSDVEIFEFKDGALSRYSERAFAFTSHALRAGGTYYLRVAVKHPYFRLRTDIHEPGAGSGLDAEPPGNLRTEHLDELLADITAQPPGNCTISPDPCAQLRRVLGESKWVLARAAAAQALGEAKDETALPILSHALGDFSKLVQLAAGLALRAMQAEPAIHAALSSSDARTRWGARWALVER